MSEPGIQSLERLRSMTQAEADDLPYGFVVLDAEGIILLYNRYESRMARLPPERVLGRSFFRNVAPCARVEAFYGRFRALADDPFRVHDRFSFRFHFLHGAQDVTIDLTRIPETGASFGSPLAGARVFMVVQRRLDPAATSLSPDALVADRDRGDAQGPLGPVLPLPAEALEPLFERLTPATAREAGRALGLTIVRAAEISARETGETGLSAAPAQLAAGALDDAVARSGFGRIALDQTARAQSRIVGCLVRPAIELPSAALAHIYEGLLEAALGAFLSEPLVARCLDTGLLVRPWRFALAPEAQADDIEPGPGEDPSDVARRLGLLQDEEGGPGPA